MVSLVFGFFFFLTILLDMHFDMQAVVLCKYCCFLFVLFFAKVDRENSALSVVWLKAALFCLFCSNPVCYSRTKI